jgi:hypothetical protein
MTSDYVVVPREPTAEMRKAARIAKMPPDKTDEFVSCSVKHSILYRAMVSAAPSHWKPISAAPKDGTELLLSGPEHGVGPGWYMAVGCFAEGAWREDAEDESELIYPAWWMPLPPAPLSNPT